jgi:hypothetical protein
VAEVTEPICGRCGETPTGHASINLVPYCHPDEGESCYQDQLIKDVLLRLAERNGEVFTVTEAVASALLSRKEN